MKILQMKADAEQVPRLSDFQAIGDSRGFRREKQCKHVGDQC